MLEEEEKTARIKTSRLDIERLNQFFERLTFCKLPAHSKKSPGEAALTTWRIVLISLNSQNDPLALEIHDNITVGRSLGNITVDLDLTPFLALELGVSREHAAIHPTEQALLIYDRNSTNGTFCNFNSASTNNPLKVENNDIISFGALNFQVKIVRHPELVT
ncbi:MAG TPA: FHA domain-containing protein [Anaerolineales bacterium]|nr:FHA domain-containing protein [Anaerolineales bacterium]